MKILYFFRLKNTHNISINNINCLLYLIMCCIINISMWIMIILWFCVNMYEYAICIHFTDTIIFCSQIPFSSFKQFKSKFMMRKPIACSPSLLSLFPPSLSFSLSLSLFLSFSPSVINLVLECNAVLRSYAMLLVEKVPMCMHFCKCASTFWACEKKLSTTIGFRHCRGWGGMLWGLFVPCDTY